MISSTFKTIVPVLPSSNIKRDVEWYQHKVGFTSVFENEMYAVLHRDEQYIHLQWHAGTEEDPLLGGSVIRIQVNKIQTIFNELIKTDLVSEDKLQLNTPWNTHEFGFLDLNQNGIFIVEAL